jgi:hypothetical protein
VENQLRDTLVLLMKAFGLLASGLRERPGVQAKSEYVGWTRSTDHCSHCNCRPGAH